MKSLPRLLVFATAIAACLPARAGTYGLQNFNALAVGATNAGGSTVMGATVAGVPSTTVASIQNRAGSTTDRALRLTQDGIDNTYGSFKLPALDATAEITALDATFKLMQFGPDTLADGFSFNFGSVAAAADDHGAGETGFTMPNGLYVGFDTYFNGPDDAPRISAWANGVRLGNATVAFNIGDQTFHTVAIHWDANGLDVTYDGAPIFTDLALPGFVPAPGDRFAFSARTGGEEQDTMIDDLQIATTPAPTLATGDVVITEFLAENGDGIEDEDSDTSDWVELYNGTGAPVNLTGWRLTNLPGNPGLWTLPNVTLAHAGYLRIFASGKNRTNPAAVLHTNFTLEKSGGYLALVKPDGVTKTSEFNYAPQSEDVSFGTYGVAQLQRYLLPPTPGSKNEVASVLNAEGPPAEDVIFSRDGGLISAAVPLAVTPPAGAGAAVRYTTNGTVPTVSSPVFPGTPLNIAATTNVRARVFQPNRLPGDVSSRTFLLLDASLTNYGTTGQPFKSNLPIVVLESYGVNIDAVKNPAGLRPFRNVYSVVLGKDPADANRASVTGLVDFQGRGGAHVRGQSSSDFGQKPYGWELWNNEDGDKAAALLGMPSDSDWVLQTVYNDKTLMRNLLPYTLNREVNGSGGAMRSQFVEVFFNQDGGPISYADYRGVYVLTEKIKRGADRIDVAEISPLATDPVTLTGGYIFKKDKPVGNVGDFSTTSTQPWGTQYLWVVEPGDFSTAQLNALDGHVQAFDAALSGANFANPLTGYKAHAEPQTFMDNHLWVETFKQIDGYWLSTYYTKERGGKIRALPIWDYNLSSGNANYNTADVTTSWFYSIASAANYPYYPRLFQDADFTLKYWDRYWQLRRSVFATSYMMGKIDAWANELTNGQYATNVVNGASVTTANGPFFPTDKANNLPPSLEAPARLEHPAMRHFDRWPILGVYVWPNPNGFATRTTFQSEVTWMKNWLTARLAWIDSQHSQPPIFSNGGGNVPAGTPLTITNPNASGAIFFTTDGSDPATPGGAEQTILAGGGAAVQWLVPTSANGGFALTAGAGAQQWTNYTDPPNLANWTTGTTGVGYERSPADPINYVSLIGTGANTETQMFGLNATCYLRLTFIIPDQAALDAIGTLKLGMKYDDGFRAYINGTAVTGRNDTHATMVSNPWTAVGSGIRDENLAIVFEDIDITALGRPALRVGVNVLAIHGLNAANSSSSDLILVPKLSYQPPGPAQLYNGPLTINATGTIRSRVLVSGAWGPITDATFIVSAAPASAANLVVSEFASDPLGSGGYASKDLEFIALRNISAGNVDLTGVQFTSGVTFTVTGTPQQLTLAPGAECIVAANPAALLAVHSAPPAGVTVFGPFTGALDNSGETLSVRTAGGVVIKEFTYSPLPPWPGGLGTSFVLERPSTNPNHNDGHNWRPGTASRGTPWSDDSAPFTGSWLADTDSDGFADGAEYSLGSLASDPASTPEIALSASTETVGMTTGTFLRLEFRRSIANDRAAILPEISPDLAAWQPAAFTRILQTADLDGTMVEIWRSNEPIAAGKVFARLRMVLP